MSTGESFGSFMAGASTGASLGNKFKDSKKTETDEGESQDAWGGLSKILGGLGGGMAAEGGGGGGAGAMLGLAAAPELVKNINPSSGGTMAALGLGPALAGKIGGDGAGILGGLGAKLLKKIF